MWQMLFTMWQIQDLNGYREGCTGMRSEKKRLILLRWIFGIFCWRLTELLPETFRKIGWVGKPYFKSDFGDGGSVLLQQLSRTFETD